MNMQASGQDRLNIAESAQITNLVAAAATLTEACDEHDWHLKDRDHSIDDEQVNALATAKAARQLLALLNAPMSMEVWSVTIENPSNDVPATFVVDSEQAAYDQVRHYCGVNDESLTNEELLAELTDGSGYAIYIDSHQVNITLPDINSAPLDQTALAS